MSELISRQNVPDTNVGDMISRQAAIDAINRICPVDTEYDCTLLDRVDVRCVLLDLPSTQPWIPVSERMPDEDKNVLVSVHFLRLEIKHKTGWNDHIKESWYVDIASQIDGEWTSASDEYKVSKNRHIVTAWMPLPEPWKGEDDGC